jgi:hypothetical protein
MSVDDGVNNDGMAGALYPMTDPFKRHPKVA